MEHIAGILDEIDSMSEDRQTEHVNQDEEENDLQEDEDLKTEL